MGVGTTSIFLNDISDIEGKSLIRIESEILKVNLVGVGSTNSLSVERGQMGTVATAHTVGAAVTVMKGDYRINEGRLYFSEAPYGPTSGITTFSSFTGRAYYRLDYTTNKIIDDISDRFDGSTDKFNLSSNNNPISGINSSFGAVLINNIFYEGQYIGAEKLSTEFKSITRLEIFGLPVMIYYVILLYLIFYFILHHSKFGRQIYACGSNFEAANTLGINTTKILIGAYSMCGLMFGIAGVLYLSLYTSAQTDTGLGFEFITITAVIIGGVSVFGGSGILWGVLLGTLFMTIITDSLNILRISPFWKMALNGIMLLSAILINHYIESRKKNEI